jgi:MOSC domain-containing protein YiiM
MVKRFLHRKRTGFYLAVLGEGKVAGRDPIGQSDKRTGVTIADIVNLYTLDF